MSDISSVPSRANSPVHLSPEQVPTARPYRFTWDPASRRPGPESVSGTTEGRGDDFAASPHPMGFLNHSSANLALGALPTEWSSSRTGFHAISTVLNNPHKRQAPPKAHSLLPPVPVADLPRVRRKDFDSYLKAITPEWSRYEHNTKLGQEGQAEIEDTQWTPRNSIAGEDPHTPTRTASQAHTQGKLIPPLDSVPAIFFEKQFNLSDPHTFATVTEQDAAAAMATPQDSSFADPFSLSHSLPLLEKFDHYSDTVEQHLVREISIRSTSFFAALTNLHDLQAESERCLSRIGKLRTQLNEVDNNSAKRGLEMVRRECKMANLGKIQSGVKMISSVVEMTGVAKGLVNAGQWGEALGVIEDLEKMWDAPAGQPARPAANGVKSKGSARDAPNGHAHGNGNGHPRSLSPLPPTVEEEHEAEEQQPAFDHKTEDAAAHVTHPVALSSLSAFSALPSHLRALTKEIAASLSSELVSVLRNDLESRINGDGRTDSNADQGLRDRLKPLLLNLVRTKGLKESVLSWREVVLADVRGIIKKILPAFDADDEESRESSPPSEGRPGLGNHLRTMSHPDFIALVQKIYRCLLNGVEGLQLQGAIIVEVLSALGSQLQQNVTDIPALEEDLSDIVSSSAELANTQAAKVISYRAEQHAALELPEFLIFFNDSWAFVIKCETTCRRMIVGLRGTVVGQAKAFLQAFHQTRVSSSARLVEDEKWIPAEVTPALQHIANIVVDSAVRDHPDLVIKSEEAIFSPYATTFPAYGGETPTSAAAPALPSSAQPPVANGTSSASAAAASSKHIRIEDRTYFLVSATARVLTMLVEYLQVVVNLPTLTTDTMGRVIEYLKAFNSRTCQVVLGAGAMRSAGLKNITAKHLALASQSLSVIFELIPYVRETFRRHLSQKQAVMLVEFDKLKRDYQEHQNEIHSKLVAIMGERLKEHIKSLKTVDWTAATKAPESGVNAYMEALVKETVMLHKVLSRYLAAPIVEYVMTQVFAAINHRLSEEYGLIELPHQEAKARLLADARFLHQKLAVMRNVGVPTGMLETVVADKSVARGPGGPGRAGGGTPATPATAVGAGTGSAPPPAPPPMIRSNTLSANQRLKGLLSGRSASGFSQPSAALPPVEKALPAPVRTESPPPVPPAADKPQTPALAPAAALGVYGAGGVNAIASQDVLSGTSSEVSLAMAMPAPSQEASAPAGFRQVEIPPSPNPDATSAPPK